MSPHREASAPRLALRTLTQHAVVARQQSFDDRPLARDDDRDELARAAAHDAEGPVAALEETLQLAEPGELGGLAHHLERRADEALVGELVERFAEQSDKIDLALAVLDAAGLAIGRSVGRVGDCSRVRAERLDHGPV